MEERNLRKTRVGVVVSDKMDKTIVVAVRDNVRHPLYNKIVKKTYKLKAHDENNECKIGDKVKVMAVMPYVIIFLVACFFMMLFPELIVIFPNAAMGY